MPNSATHWAVVVKSATNGGGPPTVTCLVRVAVQMPSAQPAPVPCLLTSSATEKVPGEVKVWVMDWPLLVTPPGSVHVYPVGLPVDELPSKVTCWPTFGLAGVTEKLAVRPPPPPPPPPLVLMVIDVDPCTLPQALLLAVTVLLPVVLQVISIVLLVELPVPPSVFQVQPPDAGVQLLAVALKDRAWLT